MECKFYHCYGSAAGYYAKSVISRQVEHAGLRPCPLDKGNPRASSSGARRQSALYAERTLSLQTESPAPSPSSPRYISRWIASYSRLIHFLSPSLAARLLPFADEIVSQRKPRVILLLVAGKQRRVDRSITRYPRTYTRRAYEVSAGKCSLYVAQYPPSTGAICLQRTVSDNRNFIYIIYRRWVCGGRETLKRSAQMFELQNYLSWGMKSKAINAWLGALAAPIFYGLRRLATSRSHPSTHTGGRRRGGKEKTKRGGWALSRARQTAIERYIRRLCHLYVYVEGARDER